MIDALMASNRQAGPHLRPAQIQLGIVGGGQLSRMLALAAAPLGLVVHILSEKDSDPASQVCKHWRKGDPSSRKDVMEFAENLDLLTFESEFYEMTAYFEAREKSKHSKKSGKFHKPTRASALPASELRIFPDPEVMQILQNRGTQKQALIQAKIPTAPFIEVHNKEDLQIAWKKFPKGFVLKKCRGGYDGFGTYYCRKSEDLHKLQSLFPSEFIAEAFIQFRRELAITLVRSFDGSLSLLPLVESRQTKSQCDWVVGPVQHSKLTSLIKKLSRFLDQLKYVGCISFELFDTGSELLINEVAPRVHNSAHYSLEALSHSQFNLHLLAGLGEKMPRAELVRPAFCMINLVGQSNDAIQIPLGLQGKLHWYGKLDNRPGRKMGHLNYVGSSSKSLLSLGLRERKKFKI